MEDSNVREAPAWWCCILGSRVGQCLVNQLVGYSTLMNDGFLAPDDPLSPGANKENKKKFMFYVVYEGISFVF